MKKKELLERILKIANGKAKDWSYESLTNIAIALSILYLAEVLDGKIITRPELEKILNIVEKRKLSFE